MTDVDFRGHQSATRGMGMRPSTALPSEVLARTDVQRAIEARDFGMLFKLVRKWAGFSYNRMGEACDIKPSRVGELARGEGSITTLAKIEQIADAFRIPGHMLKLARRPWEGPLGNIDSAGDPGPDVASAINPESSERVQYAEGNPNSPDLLTVAGLRQQVQNLDARYVSEPSTALIAETGQHLGQLAHWQTCTTTYAVRRDLHAAQAEASTLMGQLVWDASGRTDHATARTYFTQAEAAACELRDPIAEGLALLRTTFVALYGEKNPRAGLALANRTASTVQGSSHVLRGLAILHAAEAHAMLQRHKDCEKELTNAEHHFDQVSEDDVAAPLFSPSQFSRLAGSCFLFLNNASRAEKFLTDTTNGLRDGSKSHAVVLANLALAYIRQCKLDEAISTLYAAIEVVERHRGGGGLNLVFQAGRELHPWRDVPAVHDLHDRLMNLIAAG